MKRILEVYSTQMCDMTVPHKYLNVESTYTAAITIFVIDITLLKTLDLYASAEKYHFNVISGISIM